MITSIDDSYQMVEPVIVMPCIINKNGDLHKHDYFEAVYVKAGDCIHVLNDRRIPIHTGDFFVIDYGESHRYELSGQKQLDIINILFKPAMIDLSLKDCHSFSELCRDHFIRLNVIGTKNSYYFCHDSDGRLKAIVDQLIEEYHFDYLGKTELIRSMLIELMIRFVRLSTNHTRYNQYYPYTVDLIRYIEEHYMENITLSDFSKQTNYSIPFLSKKFKQDTGVGFHQYLETVRVRQSRKLLFDTNIKVTQISDLVGFSDINRFYKVFHETYHMPPGQYKRMASKQGN